MSDSNTLLYVIAGFVILHIVVGIGYLLYKIGGAPAPSEEEANTPKPMS